MRSCVAVNPQKFFTESIRRSNHAGIYEISGVCYALPISYYVQHWHRTTTSRSKTITDTLKRAAETTNAPGRLLQFFAAAAKLGYRGTMIPEDTLAEQCRVATGGKMAPRTARAALSALAAAGWITKTYTPTGRRIDTAQGWKTAQIVKISFSQTLYILIGEAMKREQKPTSAHIAHPRQKVPTMDRTEKQELRKAPVFPKTQNCAPSTTSDRTKEGAQALQAIESQTPCQPPKKTRHRRRKLIGDPARCNIEKTWSYYRALIDSLLASLNASDLQRRIAQAQTDPEYPRIFPAAVAWNDYLFLIEHNQREQRRIMKTEILPALVNFSFAFEPESTAPEFEITLPERRRRDLIQRARRTLRQSVAAAIDAIPAELLPATIADRWSAARTTAALYPMLVNAGKINSAALTDEEKKLFEAVALLTE